MELETKVLSKEIQQRLYDDGRTLATAESCTGGRIAEAIIAVPGASNYFKGAIVAYTNEVKEHLLGVSPDVIADQTAVCEEVARQMVIGACRTLHTDYALASTGIAGPDGGTSATPVGTIWIAYGEPDDVRTLRLSEDFGRDINLSIATNRVLKLFLQYLDEKK